MVFEISILHLLHHKITSNTSSMEVDLVVCKYIMSRDWWNEWKWKFERIDEENERKRNCVESEEINQINLFVFLFVLFVMIYDCFDQMNELEKKWINFVSSSFKSCFSEQIPIENFYHIKIISFNQNQREKC